jgi:amino acid permease
MTSSPAFRRFAFAYGTAFAVLYVVALKLDLALFTVYPSLGVVLPGTHHSRDVVAPAMGFLAPAMYWYGWTATAALGAFALGLVALLLPEHWSRRIWSGWLWVTPVTAMAACVYLTMPWFRR